MINIISCPVLLKEMLSTSVQLENLAKGKNCKLFANRG